MISDFKGTVTFKEVAYPSGAHFTGLLEPSPLNIDCRVKRTRSKLVGTGLPDKAGKDLVCNTCSSGCS